MSDQLGLFGGTPKETPAPNVAPAPKGERAPELAAIDEEQARHARARAILERKTPAGFDPAALFLLDLLPENLYDPTNARDAAAGPWRCKGCGALVPSSKRTAHHANHKRTATEKRNA